MYDQVLGSLEQTTKKIVDAQDVQDFQQKTGLFEDVIEHVIYRIQNTPLALYPFPHMIIPSIFPAPFYEKLLNFFPDESFFQPLNQFGSVGEGGYPDRFSYPIADPVYQTKLPMTSRLFWGEFIPQLGGARLMQAIADKLKPHWTLHPWLETPNTPFTLSANIRLLRDRDHYGIGPHTDAPRRFASLLFYTPRDARYAHAGTSVYVPRDPTFTCAGGPHYEYASFHRVCTADFVPNTLFFFMKTMNSFHGVEVIDCPGIQRDQILYYAQIKRTTA